MQPHLALTNLQSGFIVFIYLRVLHSDKRTRQNVYDKLLCVDKYSGKLKKLLVLEERSIWN